MTVRIAVLWKIFMNMAKKWLQIVVKLQFSCRKRHTYSKRRKMSYLQTTWFSGWVSYEYVHLYRWKFWFDCRRPSLCEKCWIANLDTFFSWFVIHAKAGLQSVHWLTCLVFWQVQDQSHDDLMKRKEELVSCNKMFCFM